MDEMDYNFHRYYSPELGRYLNKDPIGLGGGINEFKYVNVNPVNNKDSLGLLTFTFDSSFFGTPAPESPDVNLLPTSIIGLPENAGGTVVCDGFGGFMIHLVNVGMSDFDLECLFDCFVQHENAHILDLEAFYPDICDEGDPMQQIGFNAPIYTNITESTAYNIEKICLENKNKECNQCKSVIDARITFIDRMIYYHDRGYNPYDFLLELGGTITLTPNDGSIAPK
jgi:hypothetical protein